VAGNRSQDDGDRRRRLPSVDELLRDGALLGLEERHGRGLLLRHLRGLLEELRQGEGDVEAGLAALPAELERRLRRADAPSLVRVINATGVVVHTNLGRAPLSAAAAARVALLAAGYSNLELDLASGRRGAREAHAEGRLRDLLGAEAALVVNNNAAAVLLAVNTLAQGREVLVSRGELVEIGGSFRIPEMLGKSGATLREVGTTNRTRIADYEAARGPNTALVLKVHPSNFEIVGYTESPSRAALVAFAHGAALPLVEDLGSGRLGGLPPALAAEPSVAESLAAGVDVVTFSGDKLLGGPQAGLVAGRAEPLRALRGNPLYRALRVDKMTLAALDAVLLSHQRGRAEQEVPVAQMLARSVEAIRGAAEAVAAAVGARCPEVALGFEPGASAVGGGAAPAVELDTVLLTVAHPRLPPDALAAALRAGAPPVLARVADGLVVLDLRTVAAEEEAALVDALCAAAASG
jgi:L-seryl-tRNA(Ser) seleniumtransferase